MKTDETDKRTDRRRLAPHHLPANETNAIAYVLDEVGHPVGMAAIIDARHVLTCAHVVNSALNCDQDSQERPVDIVRVQPAFASERSWEATVKEWVPMVNLGASLMHELEDVAILELPEPVRDAGQTTAIDTALNAGADVRLFGRAQVARQGCWLKATVEGTLPNGWVQIGDIRPTGQLGLGFSGAPVFPQGENQVAGVFVAYFEPSRMEADMPAYVIANSRLRHLFERRGIETGREATIPARIVLDFRVDPQQDKETVDATIEEVLDRLRPIAPSVRKEEHFMSSLIVTFRVSPNDAERLQQAYENNELSEIAGCQVRGLHWDETYIPQTIKAALDESFDAPTRRAAIRVLSQIPRTLPWKLVDEVVRALANIGRRSDVATLRVAAKQALIKIGESGTLTVQDMLQNYSDEEMRKDAIYCVSILGHSAAGLVSAALARCSSEEVPELLHALRPSVRRLAQPTVRTVVNFLDGSDANKEAERLLVSLGSHAIPALADALREKDRTRLHEAVLRTIAEVCELGRMSTEEQSYLAIALCDYYPSAAEASRASALRALDYLDVEIPAIESTYRRALSLGSDNEVSTCLATIVVQPDRWTGLSDAIKRHLTSENDAVAALAFRATAELKEPIDVEIVHGMLDSQHAPAREQAIRMTLRKRKHSPSTLIRLSRVFLCHARTRYDRKIQALVTDPKRVNAEVSEGIARTIVDGLPQTARRAQLLLSTTDSKSKATVKVVADDLLKMRSTSKISSGLSVFAKCDLDRKTLSRLADLLRHADGKIEQQLYELYASQDRFDAQIIVDQLRSAGTKLWRGTASFVSNFQVLFADSMLEAELLAIYEESKIIAKKQQILQLFSSIGVETQKCRSVIVAEWLESESPDVQSLCLEVIVRSGGLFMPDLITLLQGKESRSKCRAAFACGLLGEYARDAIPHLKFQTAADDVRLRELATFALTRVEDGDSGRGPGGERDLDPPPEGPTMEPEGVGGRRKGRRRKR